MDGISAPKDRDDVFEDKVQIKEEYAKDDGDESYHEEDDEPGAVGKKTKKMYKSPRKSAAGRKLMRWNPAEDQLVLLTVDYVCTKQGIHIPWDDVAGEMNDFLTGDAIKQHLAKLHKFREDAGQQVPQKLEKSARRKSAKQSTAAGSEIAATTGRKKGSKSNIDVADDIDDTPSRGNSLLWHAPPANKKTKTTKKPQNPSAKDIEPVHPSASRGRGKKKDKEHEVAEVTSATHVKSKGKRGRKAKQETDSSDEDVPVGSESPTKKQKTITLRPTTPVDYNEHLSDEDVFNAVQDNDDDDGYDVSQESPKKKSTKKKESKSSGHSNNSNLPTLPPPYFPPLGVETPAVPSHSYIDTSMGYSSPPYGVADDSFEVTPPWGPEAVEAAYDGFGGAGPMASLSYHDEVTGQYHPPFGDITQAMVPAGYGFADPFAFAHMTGEDKGPFGQAGKSIENVKETSSKQKIKTPRKNSPPKYAIEANTVSRKTRVVGRDSGTGAFTNQSDAAEAGDCGFEEDGSTGIIPIADDTNRGLHSGKHFNYGIRNNVPRSPQMNVLGMVPRTQQSRISSTVMSNPLYVGNADMSFSGRESFDYIHGCAADAANTTVTPVMSNLAFPPQAMQFASHPGYSSSFSSSFTNSQSTDPMITVGPGYMGSFGNEHWDPISYEQQHEDDEIAGEADGMEEYVQ